MMTKVRHQADLLLTKFNQIIKDFKQEYGVDWYYQAGRLPAGGRVIVVAVDLPGN